jgi:uncharacterized repeat protein (TIGR01451 family)
MQKQVSENTAQGGDTLTYTIGVTVTGNSVNGMVVTDTLPANVSFAGFGSSPAGVQGSFNPGTSQLVWVLGSPLPAGAYELTYQTKVNQLVAGGVTILNGATAQYAGGTAITSQAQVVTSGQYTVRVDVYNAAGEVVKQILVQQMSQAVNSMSLSATTITALNGSGSTVNLYDGDYLLGSWNGTDGNGAPVSNGVYYIKVDSISTTGAVKSVTQQVIVSRNVARMTVNIYNEAGEVVRRLVAVVDDPSGAQMTNVALSSTVVSPGQPAAGQPTSVQIVVQVAGGSPVTLSWDGTSDNGNTVMPGPYELEVHWDNGEGGITDITKAILVVGGQERVGTILAEPNILNSKNGMITTFTIDSSQNLTVKFKVYTVAGELVPAVALQAGTNRASYDASGLASGLYLVEVEAANPNGGLVQRQILKIDVVH